MIWLDVSQYCLRIVDSDPATKPPYRAVGSVYIHGDVAIISGFIGKLLKADGREIFQELHARNIKHLIVQRAGSHRMPLARQINTPDQPFDGWWHVRLDDVVNPTNRRKTWQHSEKDSIS